MALVDADRIFVWQRFMEDQKCPGGITKTQLRTAVNAADDWVDLQLAPGSASTYVSYMNTNASAFWAAANATQKSEVLVYCLEKRYGRLT